MPHLSLATRCACCASIFGCAAVVVTYVRFPSLRHPAFVLVAHASIADAALCAVMFWAAGSGASYGTDLAAAAAPLCTPSLASLQFFGGAYMWFASAVSLQLWRGASGGDAGGGGSSVWVFLAGWIGPLFVHALPPILPKFWTAGGVRLGGCAAVMRGAAANGGSVKSSAAYGLARRIETFILAPYAAALFFNGAVFFAVRRIMRDRRKSSSGLSEPAVGSDYYNTASWNDKQVIPEFGAGRSSHAISSYIDSDVAPLPSAGSPPGVEFRHRQMDGGAGDMEWESAKGPPDVAPIRISPTRSQFGMRLYQFRSARGHASLFGSPKSILPSTPAASKNMSYPIGHSERAVRVSAMMDRYSLYPVVFVAGIASGVLSGTVAAVTGSSPSECMHAFLINPGMACTGILNGIVLVTSPNVVSRWKSGGGYVELPEEDAFWREGDTDDESSGGFAEKRPRGISDGSQDIFF
eukprot:CAMPEP_0194293876 /NCGR_PEP_ID=MMETSP0169-20130528/48874_1 /TAXON_ID=218684 /ORGANISM="Corethron pennatum, Strain L29A3" /LENGTH=465 /DNA_ID=CAMNT_0039042541 /DNA_START=119 /DNA_END=1516 /DNA_ORIENTATION=-